MKTLLKILGSIILVLILLAAGVYLWASLVSKNLLSQTYTAHASDFPIPFPVTEGNIDSPDMAMQLAVERGRHLVTARYACTECHGANLGGGVMVDAFPLGRLLGPNLTLGEGGITRNYKSQEWDLTVRHGILPDGRPSVMPSEDFQKMSDQELSDIVAYIRAQPPVDNTVPASTFGPLGKLLIATGKIIPSVLRIESHDVPQAEFPPEPFVDSAFGAHLAATCTGCHGANLAGGPIQGGDPKWPPARNLTFHATGLLDWTYEDFVKAMQDGIRPDGTPIKAPMTLVMPYAQNMTPVELEAIWVYLNALPTVENAIP
jgi:mono/diheme cytochrome c family protein